VCNHHLHDLSKPSQTSLHILTLGKGEKLRPIRQGRC